MEPPGARGGKVKCVAELNRVGRKWRGLAAPIRSPAVPRIEPASPMVCLKHPKAAAGTTMCLHDRDGRRMQAASQAAAPRIGYDEQALEPSRCHAGQADRSVPRWGEQDANLGSGERGSPPYGHRLHRVGMFVGWKDVAKCCQLGRPLDRDQRLQVIWSGRANRHRGRLAIGH